MHLLPSLSMKVGTAFLCGLILGIEREWKDKPAGLRTIMLITVGSALFMIVSELIPRVAEGPTEVMRIDPSRIAAGVVTGVGFLGAGSIIQGRGEVHGLTTAATIWVAAAIGLCTGLGFPLLAIGITLVVVTVLVCMRPFRDWLSRRGTPEELSLVAPDDSLKLSYIRELLGQHGVRDEDIAVELQRDGKVRVDACYYATSGGAKARLFMALVRLDGVHGVAGFEKSA